jgi:hypothetical protein
MWSLNDTALTNWPGGKIVPKTVLYYYDGPTFFTTEIGLTEFLFHKFDEDTNSELFLVAPTTDKIVQALKDRALSVHGALATASNLWIVDIAPNNDVRRFWKVAPTDINEDFWPEQGIAVSPLETPAADFVEQAISFFSTRFTGSGLAETRIPFMRFKTLIDAAYDSFRKIFPAPVLQDRSIGRSLDFNLLQPKFSSLIVAIDRPSINESDVRKYVKSIPNNWNVFEDGFDKNRQDFFYRMGELVTEAEKGDIRKSYAIEHFITLDQVNEIVPTTKNELDCVEFRSQTPSLKPILLNDRLGSKFRLAHRIAEREPRQVTGAIVDINEAAGTMVIRDSSARQITCIFDRADYNSLNVSMGDRIRVRGNFVQRKRRDKIIVTSTPVVVSD